MRIVCPAMMCNIKGGATDCLIIGDDEKGNSLVVYIEDVLTVAYIANSSLEITKEEVNFEMTSWGLMTLMQSDYRDMIPKLYHYES